MKTLIRIGCVAFFLIFTLSAHLTLAATIHVPADQPTIQAGIDAAMDGDLVLVAPDTYVENIDFLGKAIVVRSEAGAIETVIDGNNADTCVSFMNGETQTSIIEGFTITNGLGIYDGPGIPDKRYKGGGVTCDYSSPVIRNCSIIENTALGLWDLHSWAGGGGIACWESSAAIINCTISDNIKTTKTTDKIPSGNSSGGGIFCAGGSPMILNCTISGNTAEGSSWGGGIYCSSDGVLILNCSITGNSAGSGAGIYLSFGSSYERVTTVSNCIISSNNGEGIETDYPHSYMDFQITNCTIVGNSVGIKCDSWRATIKHCIVWNNLTATITDSEVTYSDVEGGYPGIGNIDEDPLFVGGGDVRLTEGSPCIDTGNPDPAFNDACFPPSMGTERNDIGAYGGPGACGWICWDVDGDGFADELCGGEDCSDFNPLIYPGAIELCDALDNDCDGIVPDDEVDDDGDGWLLCDDCDDTNPEINPGLYETAGTENCDDGLDNDCDGLVDTDPECEGILVPSIHHPTIQSGIDAAGLAGDQVLVEPGTYVENINFLGKAIILKSEAGADVTVIDGDYNGRTVRIDGGTTGKAILDGFTITRGSGGISCSES